MMWIALVLAVLIVGRVAMHAIQDSRDADRQRQDALADLESSPRAAALRTDAAAPSPAPTRGDASHSRGVVLPPGVGDMTPRPGQMEAR